MQRILGGLVFKVHRLCVSPNSRLESNKEEEEKTDRFDGKGNSNSHGASPVHQIISMIEWIRTSRLSIKNSLSRLRLTALMASSVTGTGLSVSCSRFILPISLGKKGDIRLPGKGN